MFKNLYRKADGTLVLGSKAYDTAEEAVRRRKAPATWVVVGIVEVEAEEGA